MASFGSSRGPFPAQHYHGKLQTPRRRRPRQRQSCSQPVIRRAIPSLSRTVVRFERFSSTTSRKVLSRSMSATSGVPRRAAGTGPRSLTSTTADGQTKCQTLLGPLLRASGTMHLPPGRERERSSARSSKCLHCQPISSCLHRHVRSIRHPKDSHSIDRFGAIGRIDRTDRTVYLGDDIPIVATATAIVTALLTLDRARVIWQTLILCTAIVSMIVVVENSRRYGRPRN